MKPHILFSIGILQVLSWMMPTLLTAQGTEKVVTQGEETFRYHYFQGSTKVSTVWHMPNGGKEGYAVAYDKQGKEIYRGKLSRMHMIRSVEFKYHPNGAVSVAHERWHPDAGIQSGGTTFTFDENGNKTGQSEDLDPRNPLTYPGRFDRETVSPKEKPQPIVERVAVLYYTEVVIVNRTKKPIRLRVIDHQQKYIGRDQFLTTEIAAGDSLGGNQYKNVDQFGNHLGHLEFELSAKKENWLKGVSLVTESPECMPLDTTHRQCFYRIVRTSKPFY
jgi:hypothetical protein